MNNIFNKITIHNYYFNVSSFLSVHLRDYLYNNLQDENFILSSNLQKALKNNLNE